MTLPRLSAMTTYMEDLRPLHTLAELVFAAFGGTKSSAPSSPKSSSKEEVGGSLLDFVATLNSVPGSGIEFGVGLERINGR